MTTKALLILSLGCILVLLSCGGDDDEDTPLKIVASDVIASDPDWQITTFATGGQDRTSDFEGYSFELFSNGDFLINFEGINDSFGAWEIDETGIVLEISLSNPKDPTDAIAGSWNIVSKSTSSLRLVSADGQGKEFRLNK